MDAADWATDAGHMPIEKYPYRAGPVAHHFVDWRQAIKRRTAGSARHPFSITARTIAIFAPGQTTNSIRSNRSTLKTRLPPISQPGTWPNDLAEIASQSTIRKRPTVFGKDRTTFVVAQGGARIGRAEPEPVAWGLPAGIFNSLRRPSTALASRRLGVSRCR